MNEMFLPGRGDLPPVVFRKDQLAARPGEDLHWAEGETQVLALESQGYLATTTVHGAQGIGAYPIEELRDAARGRHVIVHADNDPAGEAYAEAIARAIAPVALSVRIARYRDLGPGGDVLDWIAAGGTREQLDQRVANAPLWQSATGHSEDCEDSENEHLDWKPPMPLSAGDLPTFPLDRLPLPIRDFVDALAIATQTPHALAAFMVLGVIAIAVAKRFSVQVRSGWKEPLNLFLLISLGSGNRKSAVVEVAGRPLRVYEREQATIRKAEIAQAQSRRKIVEKRVDRLEQTLARTDDREQELALRDELNVLIQQLASDPALQIPIAPRLLADDTTPEKLADLMAVHDGRMGVLSAEGGIFQTMCGRYSDKRAVSLDLFLKGHAGDDMPIDRIGRETTHLLGPALTLVLAVQPEVLRGLATLPGFRGLGMLARLLYGCPESTVGRRAIAAPPVPLEIEQHYSELVAKLLNLPVGDVPLLLSPAASAAFMAFERDLEPRLGTDGDLEHLADWGAKLAGQVARQAGLFHVVNSVASGLDPLAREISFTSVNDAIAIATDFLIPHAKAAFGLMGADAAMEDAQRIVRVLASWPGETISRRDLHQNLRARFPKSEDLDPPLTLLVEFGYLERLSLETSGPGRKPSPRYAINPFVRAHNSHNPQYGVPDPHSENSVDSEHRTGRENGHVPVEVGDPWATAERVRL